MSGQLPADLMPSVTMEATDLPPASEVHSALAEVLERQGLHEEAQRQLAEAHRLMETSDTH